jgi:uncharacterized membrane protein YozB (DUF420 family)
MSGYDLPWLNAILNSSATVLLVCGFLAIRAKMVRLHMVLMLTALVVSATFLTSYLTYHFAVRGGQGTHYVGENRPLYLFILSTHTVLAAVAAPMVLVTAWLALKKRFHWHMRLARFTLPIWLYVSITGVVVFLFLKDLYPRQ